MAILYLGVNNKPKKVSNLYIGINNKAKKVTKAYIGINNKAKLFFSSGIEIDLKFINEINTITFINLLSVGRSIDATYNKYARAVFYNIDNDYNYNTIYIHNQVRYAYVNKNAYSFFSSVSAWNYSNSINYFLEKFRFDKVEILDYAFQFSYFGSKSNINLSKFKYFNNVISMNGAFSYDKGALIGNPIKAPNAIYMDRAYQEVPNISGNIYIGEKVIEAKYAFENAGITNNNCLDLASCNVGRYKSINLSNCFRNCKIHGRLNIYNYSSNLNHIFLDRYKYDKNYIYIHMPSSKTLSALNAYLNAYKICNNNEKHVILQDSNCIDIQNKAGASYKVRFYNDL